MASYQRNAEHISLIFWRQWKITQAPMKQLDLKHAISSGFSRLVSHNKKTIKDIIA